MIEKEYEISPNRLGWQHPIFAEIVQYLKKEGIVEEDEAVVKAEFTVETEELVTVSNIVTKKNIQ